MGLRQLARIGDERKAAEADLAAAIIGTDATTLAQPALPDVLPLDLLSGEYVQVARWQPDRTQLKRLALLAAAVAGREAGRNEQAVGKHRRLVGPPGARRVFEHDDLVGLRLARLDLRVELGARDPKASPGVEVHLDRLVEERVLGPERNLETVGDLDFLVASSEPKPIMDWFVAYPGVKEVTAHGETKSSVRFENGLQADLRVVPAEQFYFALHHFTGSKEHNVAMRHRALGRGLSMSEWGFKSVDEKTPAPGATSEEEVFRALGLPWIPPELREGNGEIDAAEAGKLPQLVQFADLRGVFHNHTTESDGDHTLDQMAAAAEAHGWEYLGISDHSKSSFQAGGLDEARLAKQLEDIAKLNASKKYRVRVLSGSEVDILKDGTLDFADDVLARLDFVVASVHNLFTLDREAQTARIIKAIENEHVDMVGHLTGRLLNKREPYDVDIAKVIDAAAANDTIIELNANPWRLDLDWRWWRRAAEKGVLCSINPDAHDTDQLAFAAHGVRIARKGWLTPEQVLNTRSLPEVLRWLGR